jgi:hypothetical protein
MTEDQQPRMIPNPLWCDRCEGCGYLVVDAEWEPYAVQCRECADRRHKDHSARDLFAMAALVGMGTWSPNGDDGISRGMNTPTAHKNRAEWAYRQADAMLKARKQES